MSTKKKVLIWMGVVFGAAYAAMIAVGYDPEFDRITD